jgi:hypothetical protein
MKKAKCVPNKSIFYDVGDLRVLVLNTQQTGLYLTNPDVWKRRNQSEHMKTKLKESFFPFSNITSISLPRKLADKTYAELGIDKFIFAINLQDKTVHIGFQKEAVRNSMGASLCHLVQQYHELGRNSVITPAEHVRVSASRDDDVMLQIRAMFLCVSLFLAVFGQSFTSNQRAPMTHPHSPTISGLPPVFHGDVAMGGMAGPWLSDWTKLEAKMSQMRVKASQNTKAHATSSSGWWPWPWSSSNSDGEGGGNENGAEALLRSTAVRLFCHPICIALPPPPSPPVPAPVVVQATDVKTHGPIWESLQESKRTVLFSKDSQNFFGAAWTGQKASAAALLHSAKASTTRGQRMTMKVSDRGVTFIDEDAPSGNTWWEWPWSDMNVSGPSDGRIKFSYKEQGKEMELEISNAVNVAKALHVFLDADREQSRARKLEPTLTIDENIRFGSQRVRLVMSSVGMRVNIASGDSESTTFTKSLIFFGKTDVDWSAIQWVDVSCRSNLNTSWTQVVFGVQNVGDLVFHALNASHILNAVAAFTISSPCPRAP